MRIIQAEAIHLTIQADSVIITNRTG